MTIATPSSTELQEQLDDLRNRHTAAIERVDVARDARQETAGRRVLGEADEEELAAAQAALTSAEDVASSLASALALVESRLAAAEAAESDAAQAQLVENHVTQFAGYRKALARHDRQLTTVATGTAELSAFDQELRSNRARLTAILSREDAIRAEFQRKHERLVREAPPGQVPNIDTLERQQDAALAAMRADVARQVDELLPLPNPTELESIRERHASLAPHLLAPELRRSLAEGMEFTRPPERAGSLGRTIPFTGRLYADGEMAVAEARHQAFIAAVQQLGGPAERIGAEYARHPGGLTAHAA